MASQLLNFIQTQLRNNESMLGIMIQKQIEQLASLETLYVEYPYIFTYLFYLFTFTR